MGKGIGIGLGFLLHYWGRYCHRQARMARKPRVEFFGAFYHVIWRGNQRQVIFRSDADRKYYLERLEQYRRRYSFKVYAYVLISDQSRSCSVGSTLSQQLIPDLAPYLC